MNGQAAVDRAHRGDTGPGLKPRVSVVIPVRNGESTLAETVASVFAQSEQNLEVLLVDDASTDGTPELLQQMEERYRPSLRHWRLEPNRGPSAARNFAFARARAELIAPLDADDLWAEDKLSRQLEVLERRPEAVAAYSWTAHIDGEGQYLNPGAQVRHEGDVFLQLLLGNFLENGSNPLVRAEAWRTVGGFDESLRAAEDWDFYLRLAAQGSFVVVPETQIYYRKHAGSTSVNDLLCIEDCARKVVERNYASVDGPARHLRRSTLANLYKYFLQQVYEGSPVAWRGPAGARFVYQVLRLDPSLRRHRAARLLVLKAVIRLLPAAWARTVEAKLERFPALRYLPGIHHMPMETLQTRLPDELSAPPAIRSP